MLALAVLSLLAGSAAAQIAVTGGVPSSAGLGVPVLRAWDDALEQLSQSTSALAVETLAHSGFPRRIVGIPGTRIATMEEGRQVQEHLDCVNGHGEWRYAAQPSAEQSAGLTVHKQESVYASCDARFFKANTARDDGWTVRESLKWVWVPHPSCFTSSAPVRPTAPTPLSRLRFCTLLAHKSTLMAGDTPQYSLHDLLLDWTSYTPLSCYGDRYCKEHALCGDVLKGAVGLDQWKRDERVYHPLPIGPGPKLVKREQPLEKRQFLEHKASHRSPSYGTLLRFRRSDGLQPQYGFTVPNFVHPATGVLEMNQQWLADSRRSDLVIITKPPLPLPPRSFNATWAQWWDDVSEGGDVAAVKMVEAVVRMTEEVWVPELIETLKAIRKDPSPAEQLVVYRGGWRAHPDCGSSAYEHGEAAREQAWNSPGDGPPPHPVQPTLEQIMFKRAIKRPDETRPAPSELQNLPTLFTNLQTILQNHLARKLILPGFGVPFLDLESTLSVWRSGMIGGSAAAPFASMTGLIDQTADPRGIHIGLRTSASGDCSRYCIPSPGMAIESAFIGGLTMLFEMGWAGKDESSEWVGDRFRNVREREAAL